MIAKVVTDISLDREFDYIVPPELADSVRVGSAVEIPFGNSRRQGYVLALSETSGNNSFKLKSIDAISTRRASIPAKLVELGRWMSNYYCCPLEHAIRTLLPAAVRNGKVRPLSIRVYYVPDREKAEQFIVENSGNDRTKVRCVLLRILLAGDTASTELRRNPSFSSSGLKTLLKHGLVAERVEFCRRDIFGDSEVVPDAPKQLTPDQKKAMSKVTAMLDQSKGVLLLHGVTNSGKTEVYLQAIAETVRRGKSAIVLVPEISLTPQTVRRFRARFGDVLSVLHSRLSERERFDEWNRINSGEVKIVVGARSALFAPFADLGLIVVDEEHESTYKQSESPRYHARDVAVMRGKMENAVVILGSATPSAESAGNAANGKFEIVRMKTQVGAKPAPRFIVIDRRQGERENNIFSPELQEAVAQRIECGEQCILFLNRRGYAHTMQCPDCGYQAGCENCSVNYVYSRRRETLSCHMCGDVIPAYEICPQCGKGNIRYFGSGTEKIESIAKAVFPSARIARMDSDSMHSAEDYENILARFRRGELNLLIGTQMIAKGLHFPNVTLVGIINADQGLSMPDFRAPERTFQLITQVAGRAGRGDLPGEVILQTFKPDNDAIRCAVAGDYEGFSAFDLEFRELMNFPPFSRMIAVLFKGDDDAETEAFAKDFAAGLAPYIHSGITLAGPVRAPVEKIKGKYRYIMTLRGRQMATLRAALRALAIHHAGGRIQVAVDVDPQALM